MKKRKVYASVLAIVLTAFQLLPLGVKAKVLENSEGEMIALECLEAEKTAETGGSPEAPKAYGPTPSEGQMKYYKDELAAFIHFGMNTFTGAEWGNGKEDPNTFNPTSLNTDQWIETLKDA